MNPDFVAYAQRGAAGGSMRTEPAPARYRPIGPEETNPTRSGPFASNWQVKVSGRWRRLWFHLSARPRHFVHVDRQRVAVTIHRAH